MLVCQCKGVSDRTVREVVRAGARSGREVARACGAGRSCGGCRPLVREIIEDERDTTAIGIQELVVAAG
ncbi:MAG: (2Fe-2S)-binding protein [Myxococcota bacterium]|nr:(2Fe-2S)-binding protein [Deltaproteobacteria bacterium]MCP4242923.1 (2Fe-2S)-binding protein [bacterium]MDP6073383.1 (2Fe-2S)-binding protein [Myxococcota bacterium]MBT39205.1 (2Fe-2S)-binding protein [Deltaproteobacteria bacterium]MDP6243357.1 (2Fe-2S)-binding protein [Myxococcota bacterium]